MQRRGRFWAVGVAMVIWMGGILPSSAWAASTPGTLVLQEDESAAPRQRLALGVNYTGAQIRWNTSRCWALEGRYQRGQATSHYGDVTAQVFGVRAYRFFKPSSTFPLYLGSELAYATATPATSSYRVRGGAGGLFAGLEYRITRRLALDLDIGPYVISLREKVTGVTSTNLDMVLNTALLWRVF